MKSSEKVAKVNRLARKMLGPNTWQSFDSLLKGLCVDYVIFRCKYTSEEYLFLRDMALEVRTYGELWDDEELKEEQKRGHP